MMDTEVYSPKRTFKLRTRIFCCCLAASVLLSLPFGSMFMSWQLGFYPTIGQPIVIMPRIATFLIRVIVIFSISAGVFELFRKNYNLAGGLLCLGFISSWGLFIKIYSPLYLIRWLYSYWNIPQLASVVNNTLICSGGYVIFLAGSGFLLFKKKRKIASGAYGTAKMSDGDQLKQSRGLLVGRHIRDNKLLRYDGNRHLITIAPTRSGKGVSSIIPNILTYPGSLIVVDPKGENCDYTYEARQKLGQDVYVLDPFQKSNYSRYHGTNSFNPLDNVVCNDPVALEYCNDICDSIITRNPEGLNSFWMKAAQMMYSGFLYYISQAPEYNHEDASGYKPHLRRITTINDLLKLKQDDLLKYTRKISESKKIPLQVKRVAHDILNDSNSEKMLSSIIKTLTVNIDFMDSPFLRQSLATSDFSIDKLIAGDATLYIVLPPDKMRIYQKWLRVIIELIIKKTTQIRNPKDPDIQNEKVLFILDEFANIGRMNYVKDSFSIIAGYGMQMWAVLQNISQLKKAYKDDWQTFISNSGIIQSFAANEMETAEYISKMLGETTTFSEMSAQQTRVSNIGIADNSGVNHRITERERALKTPDEVIRLPQDQQIIKKDGVNPILSRKITYYSDPEFKGKFISREKAVNQSNQAPPIIEPDVDSASEADLLNIIYSDWDNTRQSKEGKKPAKKEKQQAINRQGDDAILFNRTDDPAQEQSL
jgi:type IV secretion system protein VirD4